MGALAIVQALGKFGIFIVCLIAVFYNGFWTLDTVCCRDYKVDQFEVNDVYKNFTLPFSKLHTIWFGQTCLFAVYIVAITSRFQTQDDAQHYGFWAASLVCIQMVGFFGRGKDSQLGPAFDGMLWTHLVRQRHSLVLEQDGADAKKAVLQPSCAQIACRCFMSFCVNAVMRDCIAYTVPFLLMQEQDGMDFVKDALATAFLTNLDLDGSGIVFKVKTEDQRDADGAQVNV